MDVGRSLGVPTPANAAIVDVVHELERGRLAPDAALLGTILRAACGAAPPAR